MNKNSRLVFKMIKIFAIAIVLFSVSAVCAFAESSVSITNPVDDSTLKPGEIEVWTTFAQPPGMGDLSVTEGDTSYIKREHGVDYTKVYFQIYKDGALWYKGEKDQDWISFTKEGSKAAKFLFEDEGTYTIQVSTPQTYGQWDSVTFKVEGEYDGVDFSDETVDYETATVISEGKPVQCTLNPSNNYMTAYKLTPATSGRYVFASGGYKKNISGELYKIDDTGGLSRVEYEFDGSGTFCFVADLDAEETYILVIKGYVRKKDTIFSVGFISKESGAIMATASEINLTDSTTSIRLNAFSGSKLSGYWNISDDSIVGSESSYSSYKGNPGSDGYYNLQGIDLNARKNGTAILNFIDYDTGEIYATTRVICSGIKEESPAQTDPVDPSDKKSDTNNDTPSSEGSSSIKTIEPKVILPKTKYTYNGKVRKPSVTVMDGSVKLTEGSDYDVSYPSGRKKVGSYKVEVTLKGNYKGSGSATFKIIKAKNKMTAGGKTVTLKYSELKKKGKTFKRANAIKVKNNNGKVTYTKKSGSKKITINKKTGKITVKKGLKKGNYKVKIAVRAAGTANYKAMTKTVTVTIKIK